MSNNPLSASSIHYFCFTFVWDIYERMLQETQTTGMSHLRISTVWHYLYIHWISCYVARSQTALSALVHITSYCKVKVGMNIEINTTQTQNTGHIELPFLKTYLVICKNLPSQMCTCEIILKNGLCTNLL